MKGTDVSTGTYSYMIARSLAKYHLSGLYSYGLHGPALGTVRVIAARVPIVDDFVGDVECHHS